MELYTASGPCGAPVLGGLAVVLVVALLHALAWLLRVRPPAPLFWSVPAVVLGGAGLAGWFGYNGASPIWRPVPTSPPNAAELYAAGMAVAPIALASFGLAAALTTAGAILAVPNVVRAGGPYRWTLKHAFFGALVSGFSIAAGAVSGWPTAVVGGVGTLAIGLASLRIGRREDGRRMAAGRGFVASLFVAAALCLALGDVSRHLHHRLVGWADAVPWGGSPTAAPGQVVAACLLILGGMVAMLPHAKRVLDGRGAAGVLFSLFLLAPVSAAVLPPLHHAASLSAPDPAAVRQRSLRKLGIDLVTLDADPWTPRPTLVVGPYWAYWEDALVVPFQGGRVPSTKLLDGVAVDALDKFTPIATGEIAFDVDRNVDFVKLRPLLAAAQQAELLDVHFTTRTNLGALRTLRMSLHPAPEDGVHILLGPERMTWIDGDNARDTTLAELGDRDFVLHIDDYTKAPRLFDVLHASRDREVRLWLK